MVASCYDVIAARAQVLPMISAIKRNWDVTSETRQTQNFCTPQISNRSNRSPGRATGRNEREGDHNDCNVATMYLLLCAWWELKSLHIINNRNSRSPCPLQYIPVMHSVQAVRKIPTVGEEMMGRKMVMGRWEQGQRYLISCTVGKRWVHTNQISTQSLNTHSYLKVYPRRPFQMIMYVIPTTQSSESVYSLQWGAG